MKTGREGHTCLRGTYICKHDGDFGLCYMKEIGVLGLKRPPGQMGHHEQRAVSAASPKTAAFIVGVGI